FLEARIAGASGPFKDDGFGGDKNGAGLFHPPQGNLLVDGVAAAGRIRGDIDAKIENEQIKGGLQYTDMGFDPGEHDLRPTGAAEALKDAWDGTATKRCLVESLRQPPGQFGHRRPQSLW